MANIRDVARKAGVSIATVSHVFNGTRPVSEEVRLRVAQAAAELHYYPNHLARSLTTKRTGTVGMVVSDIANPFFAELIRGFEATLSPHQYNVIVCNTEDNPLREEEYLLLLMAKRVDGIAGEQGLSLAKPTGTHLSSYKIAGEEFSDQLAKLRTLVDVRNM